MAAGEMEGILPSTKVDGADADARTASAKLTAAMRNYREEAKEAGQQSAAEHQAQSEGAKAYERARLLFSHKKKEAMSAAGAPVRGAAKFRLAADAVKPPLSGVLVAADGLTRLRTQVEHDWFSDTWNDETKRATERIESEPESYCHTSSSPHFDGAGSKSADPNRPHELLNHLVLDPKAQFRHTWDAFQLVFLAYVSIFVPFRVCFNMPPVPDQWDFWVVRRAPHAVLPLNLLFADLARVVLQDVVVDGFFLADVILSFFTGYVRKVDGHTEWKRELVVQHYLRGWFLIDLVSILPVNYIQLAVNDSGSDLNSIRMLRFLKLLKLLRLVRVGRILERYESALGVMHATAGNVVQIVKLCVMIFWVGHVLCCFWFMVGEDETNADGSVTTGWIEGQGLTASDAYDQYLTSLYWGMTTMTTVGYGDISASTNTEKVYSIISMLIGGFMFGMIIGSLTNIISTANPLEARKKEKLQEIAGWLQIRKVPAHLRSDIYEFYRSLYTRRQGSTRPFRGRTGCI